MSRFRKDPDPRFWRLNRSVEFDWRLAPYDIDQSQAHARALRQIDVLSAEELDQLDAGLERVRARIGERGFEFEEADEDIHMAVERLLEAEVGPLAGKLHTGRSRNDQVATDVAMVVQAHSLRAIELCGAVMGRVLGLAETHRDWPMPGYTHLQRAQPVYLGHHLLAYFWMLGRDVLRFQFALDSASVMPLGSGALAGVNWEIDRREVADDLGFEHLTANSIDGASNRDFVLDYLAAASTAAMHLSRLGSEIVIWSSSEFGFCELDESFSSGSSIMPQKKNPDSAELLRAKAPRVAADLLTLLGTMHALPLTYSKDMQEDKEPLFDAIDTVEPCLEAADGMLGWRRVRPRAPRGRLGRRDAGRDRDRRPAGAQGYAVPRGPRRRRRPRPRRGRERQEPLRADAGGAATAQRAARRFLLRRPQPRELARVEADRGRDRLRAARGPDRARPRDARRRRGPTRRGAMSAGGSAVAIEPRLGVEFFDRSVHEVARDLIGCRLFYEGRGGVIVETESYERDDPACHAYVGLTDRTEVLFGPPGRAYVYLSYGIHSLLNFVAEPEGDAAAVLIRALEPTHGLAEMRRRRHRDADLELCSGPGKLTEALGVGLDSNGADLSSDPFLILPRRDGWGGEIVTGPRVGITKAVERPWRFSLAGNPHVSRPAPS